MGDIHCIRFCRSVTRLRQPMRKAILTDARWLFAPMDALALCRHVAAVRGSPERLNCDCSMLMLWIAKCFRNLWLVIDGGGIDESLMRGGMSFDAWTSAALSRC